MADAHVEAAARPSMLVQMHHMLPAWHVHHIPKQEREGAAQPGGSESASDRCESEPWQHQGTRQPRAAAVLVPVAAADTVVHLARESHTQQRAAGQQGAVQQQQDPQCPRPGCVRGTTSRTGGQGSGYRLSLIHISEPTRPY